MKWISVKDRLPEDGNEVVIFTGNNISLDVMYYKRSVQEEPLRRLKGFYHRDHCSVNIYDECITHWMLRADFEKCFPGVPLNKDEGADESKS